MEVVSSLTEYLNSAMSFEPGLTLSIIIRTMVVAGILLFVIKWVGSKGVSQLTTYQLIIILSLGNIVAEPMINTETPILSMVTVVIIIILVFKILDYVSAKNKRMEKIINPEVIELVKDGQVIKEGMIKARIGNKEYESFMRLAGIKQIDQIEISNLEINGQISFIRKSVKNSEHF
ncbi:DUF421 domain-containing protein [Candidatus Nitrosocosmicus hydrocola]|jgi:uncharacterized membrane protein YcaP (DUF421 family)|uniref:DUF421 domain-containing protein n=1 Tax=Candidatus Nitrosocosmicus hydrocola TaxID=1826872 RepID=UPI0011E5E0CF|nr:YetF domain-containing protein [Candidatus Nitrosocosmicus hydrocola]